MGPGSPVLLPGAEPWSCRAGDRGVLCLHGFTGSPLSMRPVAEAFAAAGWSVELPRLPGHGTSVDDLMGTTWDDWRAEADSALARLRATCSAVVVCGQSMGGALALALGLDHHDLAGLVVVNPLTRALPDEVLDMVKGMVAEGDLTIPGDGSDIAKPDARDASYPATPLPPLLSLMEAVAAMEDRYAGLTQPLLVVTSRQDHVVDPEQSDHLADHAAGEVERLFLERSYHVATLDLEADEVIAAALAFAARVAA